MNAFCMNCQGEHPPACCPEQPGEHLADAVWVTEEIGLEALTFRRSTPKAPGWRQPGDAAGRAAAPDKPLSHETLLEQLNHRFSLAHAVAQEGKQARVLTDQRSQRRLHKDTARRVDHFLAQADAVLTTKARGRLGKAERTLLLARDLDELDPRIHMRLGFVLAMMGRTVEAAASFERVGSVLPAGQPAALRASALLLASRAAFLAGDHKAAWEYGGQSESTRANDAGVHYQKALVASRYAQADRSVKLCLRRAVELDPTYFTLAALDPGLDDATWNQAVQPLLQEVDDGWSQGLLEQKEASATLARELAELVDSPAFQELTLPADLGAGEDHDSHAAVRAALSRARNLAASLDLVLQRGPAAQLRLDAQLHRAAGDLKHWIQVLQKALLQRIQQSARKALPAQGARPARRTGPHVQRLVELLAEAEQLEAGVGQSRSIAAMERMVAKEVHAIEVLSAPEPRRGQHRAGRGPTGTMGRVGFYLAVMTAVAAALGADLLALRHPSFALHPFWVSLGCAALTVYLPELVARLASRGSQGLRLHELAFLPAYMIFPVLPAGLLVNSFPTPGMFLLMMAVCALMSLMFIVGASSRRR